MVGQLCKELTKFVTLNVTFKVKYQGSVHTNLFPHTYYKKSKNSSINK